MTAALADIAAQLSELTDWLDDQIADEHASPQAVVEHVVTRVRAIRDLTGEVTAAALSDLQADPRVIAAGKQLAAANRDGDIVPEMGVGELARIASTMRLMLALVLDAIAGRPR